MVSDKDQRAVQIRTRSFRDPRNTRRKQSQDLTDPGCVAARNVPMRIIRPRRGDRRQHSVKKASGRATSPLSKRRPRKQVPWLMLNAQQSVNDPLKENTPLR